MSNILLPGYTYAKSVGRYRSVQTGRFVSHTRITELMDAQIQQAEQRLQALATAFYEGQLAPAVWLVAARDQLRRLHIQQAALAKGGFAQLTQGDYGRIGAVLRTEYAKLVGTMGDVQNGAATLPQALNRMRAQAGAARSEYFRTQRDVLAAVDESGMVRIVRRILDPTAMHCGDCIEYYERGWVLVRELVPPGEGCQCLGNCRCRVIWHRVPVDELQEWLGTKRQVVKQSRWEVYEHITER